MLNVGAELRIDGVIWRVAAHPSAPQSPWSRLGSTSVVHRLEGPSGPRALKVFAADGRGGDHATRARQLEAYRDVGGLRAAERSVVTALGSDGFPAVTDALWMPWIEGYTWSDVVRVRTALTPEQSLHLARALADVLARLEARGAAHCNISGESVMITTATMPTVELVDLEHLFASDVTSPQPPSRGAPSLVRGGAVLHDARADRFSGAVVLAEMLGWCDGAVRSAAAPTRFFESEELLPGPRPERARFLSERLAAVWGAPVAALFDQAFSAASPLDAPPLSAWVAALAGATPSVAPPPASAFTPSVAAPAPTAAARPIAPPTAPRMGGPARGGPPKAVWVTALVLVALIGAGGFFLLRWRPSASPDASVAGSPAPSGRPSTAPAAPPTSPTPVTSAASAAPTSAPSTSSAPAPASTSAPSTSSAPAPASTSTPSTSSAPAPASAPSAAPSPSPESKPEIVGALRDVVMCRRVDAKGAPVDNVRVYDPFTPFCCAFRVTAGHKGAEIKATWHDPQGFSRVTTATVGAEEESYVNVTLQPASGAWVMGPYSLVLQMPGTPDKEVRFDVSATGR